MLFPAYVPVRRSGRSRRTAQAGAQPTQEGSNISAATPATALPEALPCENRFELSPEDVGPMGNVILCDAEEVRILLLVARRVSSEEAERCGGCVIVTSAPGAEPKYYRITDTDDEVYGRASYLTRASLACMMEDPCAFSCSSASSSSADCSDEDGADCPSTTRRTETSMSCRCA